MCTNDSNSGRGSKTSSPLCLPSNKRRWRDECALGIHQNTTGENGKDIVAFARNDDLSKPSLMQPLSEFLRNKCRVHGQRQLSDINPFTIKFVFELGQHEDQ